MIGRLLSLFCRGLCRAPRFSFLRSEAEITEREDWGSNLCFILFLFFSPFSLSSSAEKTVFLGTWCSEKSALIASVANREDIIGYSKRDTSAVVSSISSSSKQRLLTFPFLLTRYLFFPYTQMAILFLVGGKKLPKRVWNNRNAFFSHFMRSAKNEM